MSSTILFIGRFQPFHRGHLWVIKKILRKKAHLLIGIGSTQYKNTSENPFSLRERVRMIQAALKEAEIDAKNYKIIPIPDIHDDAEWPAHVRKCVQTPFNEIWTGRPIVKKLFQKYDHVKIVHLIRWKDISATRVRASMRQNGARSAGWKKWVPKSVERILTQSPLPPFPILRKGGS